MGINKWISCGEVFAVCGGYSTISLHLAASASCASHCTYGHIRTIASCSSWSVAIATPPALMISCK